MIEHLDPTTAEAAREILERLESAGVPVEALDGEIIRRWARVAVLHAAAGRVLDDTSHPWGHPALDAWTRTAELLHAFEDSAGLSASMRRALECDACCCGDD